jgi:hypothetical protein
MPPIPANFRWTLHASTTVCGHRRSARRLTGNAEFHREIARADQQRFDVRHGCNPRGVGYGWRCGPGLLALPFIAAGAVVAGAAAVSS